MIVNYTDNERLIRNLHVFGTIREKSQARNTERATNFFKVFHSRARRDHRTNFFDYFL